MGTSYTRRTAQVYPFIMVSVSKVSCLVAAAFAAVVSSVQADTIAEIAAGNPDFSTLVAVLQEFAPELLDAASSEDAELTVFAPNNNAFAGLLTSLDVELSELDPMLVKSILEAHVITEVVLSTDLTTLRSPSRSAAIRSPSSSPKGAALSSTTLRS